MNNTSRLVQAGAVLALTAGLAVAAQAGSPYSLPNPLNGSTSDGTPGNGFALGGSTMTLTGSGNNYNFTISGSLGSNAVLNFPGISSFGITGASLTISGALSRSGSIWSLTSGTETINGNIAACSSSCGTVAGGWSANTGTIPLMSATLTTGAFNAGGSHPTAYAGGSYDYLGFQTNFNSGTSGTWLTNNNINQGSPSESVYLYALTSQALSTSIFNSASWNALVQAIANGSNLAQTQVNAYVGSYSTVPLPLPGLLLGGGLLGLGVFARRRTSAKA